MHSRLKSNIFFLHAILSFLFTTLDAGERLQQNQNLTKEAIQEYFPNDFPLITQIIWEKTSPYFVPKNHKAREALDKIFSDDSVLNSIESFQKAGFEVIMYRTGRRIVIARHPALKNFIIKTYLDIHPTTDWSLWVLRARGSVFVQEVLDRINMNRYFKVPKKWIYPIRRVEQKKNHEIPYPKNFILLVEDMHIAPRHLLENKLKKKVSKTFMHALFLVLRETGYSDCHADNLPLCKDGKIALIDLEHVNEHPVHFRFLDNRFSDTMLKYWHQLVSTYIPPERER